MNEYRFKIATGHGFYWITVTAWTLLKAEDAVYAKLGTHEHIVQMSKIYPGAESEADLSSIPHSNDVLIDTTV